MRCVLLLAAFLLSSCSSSRIVSQDKVFPAGKHRWGTLLDSDVLVQPGATLKVNYAERCRIFVASGGTLEGFEKGIRNVTIYTASRANIPPRLRADVRKVKNISASWKKRKTLLPAGVINSRPGGGDPGSYGHYHHYHHGYYGYHYYPHSRSYHHRSRPTSVTAKSYHKAN